ncbi:acyltransferase [Fusobacteria bacterium ZRK30]|nr:acyltransferase [Fusobacteria bacterium ZRK30]
MFLNSINYFRGIAIFIIVLGHSYWLAGFEATTNAEKTFEAIATGGTALFVFVSGFMFHHVFYKRTFDYKKFLMNKGKNVVIPYLIMSGYVIYKAVFIKGSYLNLKDIGIEINNKITAILFYYGTGYHMIAYWYIPFAILLFVASPIYLRYIKLSNKTQIILIVAGIILSGFIHRPTNNFNTLQSLIYFSPIYVMGIWSSINKSIIYEKLKGKEIWLALGFLAMGYFQGVVLDHPYNYQKAIFEYRGIDLTIYQKVFMIYFLMILLHRLEDKKIWILDFMAKYSFAVFFIHGYLLMNGMELKKVLGLNFQSGILGLLIIAFVITMGSCFIASLIKKVLPKHSRKLIGA